MWVWVRAFHGLQARFHQQSWPSADLTEAWTCFQGGSLTGCWQEISIPHCPLREDLSFLPQGSVSICTITGQLPAPECKRERAQGRQCGAFFGLVSDVTLCTITFSTFYLLETHHKGQVTFKMVKLNYPSCRKNYQELGK